MRGLRDRLPVQRPLLEICGVAVSKVQNGLERGNMSFPAFETSLDGFVQWVVWGRRGEADCCALACFVQEPSLYPPIPPCPHSLSHQNQCIHGLKSVTYLAARAERNCTLNGATCVIKESRTATKRRRYHQDISFRIHLTTLARLKRTLYELIPIEHHFLQCRTNFLPR